VEEEVEEEGEYGTIRAGTGAGAGAGMTRTGAYDGAG
jgi:hypothetical protein